MGGGGKRAGRRFQDDSSMLGGGCKERWSFTHSPTTHLCCGNYFPTRHWPVMVHGPGVGDPWSPQLTRSSYVHSSSNNSNSSSSSMVSTKIIETAPSERKSRDGAEFRPTGSAAPELVAPVPWWEGQLHPGLRCSFWCLLLKVRSWLLVRSKLHAPWVLLFPSWEATLAFWRMIFFYTEVSLVHHHTGDPLYPFHLLPHPFGNQYSVLCVGVFAFIQFGLFIYFVCYISHMSGIIWFVFLHLTYHIAWSFKLHLYCKKWQDFIFYGWIVFLCVCVSHLYSFTPGSLLSQPNQGCGALLAKLLLPVTSLHSHGILPCRV